MNPVWRDAMERFYRGVDADILRLGASCRVCGDCCHFDTAGHVLYASRLERLFLAAGAVPSASPDTSPDLISAGLRCPYQESGRCRAGGARTLGCRLHFCAMPRAADASGFCEEWHKKLKHLHDELGVDWQYIPLLPLPRNPGAAEEVETF